MDDAHGFHCSNIYATGTMLDGCLQIYSSSAIICMYLGNCAEGFAQ